MGNELLRHAMAKAGGVHVDSHDSVLRSAIMAERSKTKKTDDKPRWTTLAEAESKAQGWTKHTRSMDVQGGTLYQTTTEHRAPGAQGSRILACSEALVFAPSSKK